MKIIPNTIKCLNLFIKNNREFDKIMFKSEFHKTEFEKIIIKLNNDKYLIIPNGLRVNEINKLVNKNKNEIKNPYRFCYCSSYVRGLDNILKCVWPFIVKNEPRAELHIYYGLVHETEDFKKYIKGLIAFSKNVMDHGREPLEMVIREKMLSTYQLYLNDHPAEIDCINIREGILCECIPIISNSSIYKDRDGLKIDIDFNTRDAGILTSDLNNAGILISNINKYYNDNDIKLMVSQIKKSELLIDWKFVSNLWLNEENYLCNTSINCYDKKIFDNNLKK